MTIPLITLQQQERFILSMWCSRWNEKKSIIIYKSVSGTTDDFYDFYYGDVDISVNGNFNEVSVYCFCYMGGENLLV